VVVAARCGDEAFECGRLAREEIGQNFGRRVFDTSGEQGEDLDVASEPRQGIGEVECNLMIAGVATESFGQCERALFVPPGVETGAGGVCRPAGQLFGRREGFRGDLAEHP
jgi:hypothetical protein